MQNWFEIQNKAASDTADIWIYSEIGGYDVNAKSFIDELKEVKDKAINVHINSLGGSVFDGLAIYNALKNHTKKVTTKVEGIAASIASVIAMAGDEIEMAQNSLFMVHNPFTMAGGDANELRQTANVLDKIRDEIANIYSGKTSKDIETMVGLMNAETWFNADETIEVGFANSITKGVEVSNNYDISSFKNISHEKINQILLNTKNLSEMAKLEDKEIQNEKSLLEKIKSLFNETPIKNDHEEGHDGDDESEAERTDWAKTYEELKDRVENLEIAVAELKEETGNMETEIENKTSELETANEEILAQSKEISKLKATKTDVSATTDPSVVENKAQDANAAFFNAMVNSIKKKVK